MKPSTRETLLRGTIFDVVAECWGAHDRQIVEHPGAVAIVAVDGEERVVLVRQTARVGTRRALELPAGTLERGEQPLACAQRELAEETGLRAGGWRRLASFWTSPASCAST